MPVKFTADVVEPDHWPGSRQGATRVLIDTEQNDAPAPAGAHDSDGEFFGVPPIAQSLLRPDTLGGSSDRRDWIPRWMSSARSSGP